MAGKESRLAHLMNLIEKWEKLDREVSKIYDKYDLTGFGNISIEQLSKEDREKAEKLEEKKSKISDDIKTIIGLEPQGVLTIRSLVKAIVKIIDMRLEEKEGGEDGSGI